jgi:hypothetical protein
MKYGELLRQQVAIVSFRSRRESKPRRPSEGNIHRRLILTSSRSRIHVQLITLHHQKSTWIGLRAIARHRRNCWLRGWSKGPIIPLEKLEAEPQIKSTTNADRLHPSSYNSKWMNKPKECLWPLRHHLCISQFKGTAASLLHNFCREHTVMLLSWASNTPPLRHTGM